MWWRLTRAEFRRNLGEGNRMALKAIVDAGEVPGLLGYDGGRPIAWVSVGPRGSYPVIERSRTLKPVDDRPVWSIVCFFVAKPFRNRGLMGQLLRASFAYAERHDARIVEAYPVEPGQKGLQSYDGFTGVASVFRQAGFNEVARRGERQIIMRRFLGAQ